MTVKILFHKKDYGELELLLDDDDYKIIQQYNLSLKLIKDTTVVSRDKFYVDVRKYVKGKSYRGLLHRLIMSCPADMVVDHINGNPLDNRKCNLRICTHKENCSNRNFNPEHIDTCTTIFNYKAYTPALNQSGIKNIKWSSKANKWEVGYKVNGKYIYIGLYSNLEDAKQALKDSKGIR